MAKKRAPSKHSRAARRATSPSINTDRSLKDVQPPRSSSSAGTRPSILAVHHSAGVQKKSKQGRKAHMSAKARRRHEKGLEMAEAVVERTSVKMQRSLGRNRVVKDRSRAWEAINRDADEELEGEEAEDVKMASKVQVPEEDKEWETDEEMDAAEAAAQLTGVPVAATADEDGDEIL